MNQPFPGDTNDLPRRVAEAGKLAASSSPRFAHHLAKAAVERWLPFDLAAVLDEQLHSKRWTLAVREPRFVAGALTENGPSGGESTGSAP